MITIAASGDSSNSSERLRESETPSAAEMYPRMRRCDVAATLVRCRDGDNAGRGDATAVEGVAARERPGCVYRYLPRVWREGEVPANISNDVLRTIHGNIHGNIFDEYEIWVSNLL